ncbi:unnamed protein product [Symbiodinium sp. CCMP2456]|nr:unnamed protein product [Symbiodinium sp. CCMP2456]
MTKAEQKKAVEFTRMCKFWKTNECKMGADCTFAHESSELRPSPKPCFEFSKTGTCKRGEACRFVHSLDCRKSKKPKDLPAQSANREEAEPKIRPGDLYPQVRHCHSREEFFNVPQLHQLAPPVASDFGDGFRPDLHMREIEAYARAAKRDLRQTAGAGIVLESSLSEAFDPQEFAALHPTTSNRIVRPADSNQNLSALISSLSTSPSHLPDVRPQSFWI